MFLTDGYTCTTDVRRSQQVPCYECSMLNVCCQKQLKSVVRGTSLPDRSPEGGAVKVSLAFARAYLQDWLLVSGSGHNQGFGFVNDA